MTKGACPKTMDLTILDQITSKYLNIGMFPNPLKHLAVVCE